MYIYFYIDAAFYLVDYLTDFYITIYYFTVLNRWDFGVISILILLTNALYSAYLVKTMEKSRLLETSNLRLMLYSIGVGYFIDCISMILDPNDDLRDMLFHVKWWESMLESLPQFYLQSYIITSNSGFTPVTVLSLVVSIFSLAYCLMEDNKERLSKLSYLKIASTFIFLLSDIFSKAAIFILLILSMGSYASIYIVALMISQVIIVIPNSETWTEGITQVFFQLFAYSSVLFRDEMNVGHHSSLLSLSYAMRYGGYYVLEYLQIYDVNPFFIELTRYALMLYGPLSMLYISILGRNDTLVENLYMAINYEDEDKVREIANKGININIKKRFMGRDPMSPIELAMSKGKESLARMLFDIGVDFRKVYDNNRASRSFLIQAIISNHLEAVKRFVNNVKIDVISEIDYTTPIHSACRSNNNQILDYFIDILQERKIEEKLVMLRDGANQTPFDILIKVKNYEIADKILNIIYHNCTKPYRHFEAYDKGHFSVFNVFMQLDQRGHILSGQTSPRDLSYISNQISPREISSSIIEEKRSRNNVSNKICKALTSKINSPSHKRGVKSKASSDWKDASSLFTSRKCDIKNIVNLVNQDFNSIANIIAFNGDLTNLYSLISRDLIIYDNASAKENIFHSLCRIQYECPMIDAIVDLLSKKMGKDIYSRLLHEKNKDGKTPQEICQSKHSLDIYAKLQEKISDQREEIEIAIP